MGKSHAQLAYPAEHTSDSLPTSGEWYETDLAQIKSDTQPRASEARWVEALSLIPGLRAEFDREFAAELHAIIEPYIVFVKQGYPGTFHDEDTCGENEARWETIESRLGTKAAGADISRTLQILGDFSTWASPTPEDFRCAVIAHTCEKSGVGEQTCLRHSLGLTAHFHALGFAKMANQVCPHS